MRKTAAYAVIAAMFIARMSIAQQPTKAAAKNKDDGKVVFIVSSAGSMLSSWGQADEVPNNTANARQQLEKAINGLRPDQQVIVIYSADGECKTDDGGDQFRLATDAVKHQICEFADKVNASGGTDLRPGVKKIAKLRPDVVWLITNRLALDGREWPRETIELARSTCADGNTRINTVLNFDTDDDTDAEQDLYDLAASSGGFCIGADGKVVTKRPGEGPPHSPATGPSVFQEK